MKITPLPAQHLELLWSTTTQLALAQDQGHNFPTAWSQLQPEQKVAASRLWASAPPFMVPEQNSEEQQQLALGSNHSDSQPYRFSMQGFVNEPYYFDDDSLSQGRFRLSASQSLLQFIDSYPSSAAAEFWVGFEYPQLENQPLTLVDARYFSQAEVPFARFKISKDQNGQIRVFHLQDLTESSWQALNLFNHPDFDDRKAMEMFEALGAALLDDQFPDADEFNIDQYHFLEMMIRYFIEFEDQNFVHQFFELFRMDARREGQYLNLMAKDGTQENLNSFLQRLDKTLGLDNIIIRWTEDQRLVASDHSEAIGPGLRISRDEFNDYQIEVWTEKHHTWIAIDAVSDLSLKRHLKGLSRENYKSLNTYRLNLEERRQKRIQTQLVYDFIKDAQNQKRPLDTVLSHLGQTALSEVYEKAENHPAFRFMSVIQLLYHNLFVPHFFPPGFSQLNDFQQEHFRQILAHYLVTQALKTLDSQLLLRAPFNDPDTIDQATEFLLMNPLEPLIDFEASLRVLEYVQEAPYPVEPSPQDKAAWLKLFTSNEKEDPSALDLFGLWNPVLAQA